MHACGDLLLQEPTVQEWEEDREGAEVRVDKLVEEVTRRQLQADGWRAKTQKLILSVQRLNMPKLHIDSLAHLRYHPELRAAVEQNQFGVQMSRELNIAAFPDSLDGYQQWVRGLVNVGDL